MAENRSFHPNHVSTWFPAQILCQYGSGSEDQKDIDKGTDEANTSDNTTMGEHEEPEKYSLSLER